MLVLLLIFCVVVMFAIFRGMTSGKKRVHWAPTKHEEVFAQSRWGTMKPADLTL